MSREAEIVVIGAGMVGAAFACLLAEQGDRISIAVLDIREPGQLRDRIARSETWFFLPGRFASRSKPGTQGQQN